MTPPDVYRKLPRCLHLRRSSDFSRNRRTGVRARTPHFVVCRSDGPEGGTRLGLVVGRRVGSAVERNRVKRRLREIFRLNRSLMPEASDLVIVALPGAVDLGYEDMEKEILGCLTGQGKGRTGRKEPRPG